MVLLVGTQQHCPCCHKLLRNAEEHMSSVSSCKDTILAFAVLLLYLVQLAYT